jgi:SAM-dependent methyltransferase
MTSIPAPETFAPCAICGSQSWQSAYTGPVRNGAFGALTEPATIAQCGGCGVQRLSEQHCIPDSFYETDEYRATLDQQLSEDAFYEAHDALQRGVLDEILEEGLRGKVLADVGCGPGGFTDHVAGLTQEIWAIEPSHAYREILRSKGYRTFPYATEVPAGDERADIAVTLQVIEHVADPRAFLSEIAAILKPGSKIIVTTPSRNDVLMTMAPDWFAAFFYRAVHRWYFDAGSLKACGEAAGLTLRGIRSVQRYGLSNALHWLRDRRPRGDTRMEPVDELLDQTWRAHLAKIGRGDTLYAVFTV